MPFGLIPFLLLFIPILEIGVFIVVGGEIGVAATLGMILLTAIIGSILLRVQGFATLKSIQEKSERGEIPGRELVSGVMIMIAGVLLLTPGFVTDALGFLLFFPPFRHLIWQSIASKVVIQTNSAFSGTTGFGQQHEYPHRQEGEDIVDLDPSEFSEKPNPESPWNKLKGE
ncbi:MAG: FxsA family protein [Pseudomonadota bacterium]